MIEDIYPLSPLQEGFYYHWLESPDTNSYLLQMKYEVEGKIEVDIFEKSYHFLIKRHAILRTFFNHDLADRILQVVDTESKSQFTFYDLSHEKNSAVKSWEDADRNKKFDLQKGSQMRLTVAKISNDRYELIWSSHHILIDGWSMGLLMREFSQIYSSLIEKKNPYLNELKPYSSYIKWLLKQDSEKSYAYWKDYLIGYKGGVSIPNFKQRKRRGYKKKITTLPFNEENTRAIKSLCIDNGVTVSMFLHAVWSILLGKYNNACDVVFGTVVSGRPAEIEGVDTMVGLFSNTIPFRVNFKDGMSFSQLLQAVQNDFILGSNHHYVQLAKIQADIGLGNRLFTNILVFENYPQQYLSENHFLKLRNVRGYSETNYNLILRVALSEILEFSFDFNENFYADELIKIIMYDFERIVITCINDPVTLIENLLHDYKPMEFANPNQVHSACPTEERAIEIIERQAARVPQDIALIYEKNQITYKNLNETANRLANFFKAEYRVQPGELIGIKLERSEWIIITILAILKCECAYVPIDVGLPPRRIEYIISECSFKVLLDETILTDFKSRADLYSPDNSSYLTIDATIYVIYTSGSTGPPKGVVIGNNALIDYFHGLRKATNIDNCYTFGLVSTLAADLGNTVIYSSLFLGRTLRIFSTYEIHDSDKMREAEVDCLKIVPSHWKSLQDPIRDLIVPKCCLIFGGESLTHDIVDSLHRNNTACSVYNHYGPTESTIGKLIKKIDFENPEVELSLGYPFGENYVYVLDEKRFFSPVGVIGEIHIGGRGLAKGYFKNEKLTAEKFVPDPLRLNSKLYKTGDLGRVLPSGEIEFLGRSDNQIKIHGFRTELGEIEKGIADFDGVRSNIVIAEKKGNDISLISYIVADKAIDLESLKQHLRLSLPNYMIPKDFVFLKEMPLTVNGKIDKSALPQVQGKSQNLANSKPKTELEVELISIFSRVLDIQSDTIDIDDNFFEKGGHSLSAIRLVSHIKKLDPGKFSVKQLIEHPTVRSIAAHITSGQSKPSSSILIALKNNGSQPPLFCAPPGGGNSIAYYALARLLDNDQPVYAFQAHGLNDGTDMIGSIEQMAEEYITAMQLVDSRGPYTLLGYSFGGRVIYEMALQLIHNGFTVKQLIIFDAMAPIHLPANKKSFLPQSHLDWIIYSKEYYNLNSQKSGRKVNLKTEELTKLTDYEQLKLFRSRLLALGEMITLEQLQAHINVYINSVTIDYFPSKYPLNVPITLFKASQSVNDSWMYSGGEGIAHQLAKFDLGWSEFVNGKITLHYMNCNHAEMMEENNVKNIISELKISLAQ